MKIRFEKRLNNGKKFYLWINMDKINRMVRSIWLKEILCNISVGLVL